MDGSGGSRQYSQPCVALVEGKNDYQAVDALLKHLGLSCVQPEGVQGKGRLRSAVRAAGVTPGFDRVRALAVIRDADSNPGGMLQSARDAFVAAAMPCPERSGGFADGEFEGRTLRTGVLILPGDGRSGMIEDLCNEAWQSDPAWPCVERYMACIDEALGGAGLPLPGNLAKARTHALLASREEPDKHLGTAALAGYVNWDHPAFAGMRAFLAKLASA